MSNAINIVVLEDNLVLQELMVDHLLKIGHRVEGVSCAEDLDDYLAQNPIDILVLDLNLPGEDGLSISKRLREAQPGLYIVMLTAKVSEKDKTLGYASGADIYLTKPASPAEVTAAISSIERRILLQRQQLSGLSLNLQKMQLVGTQGLVSLGSYEFAILKALIEAPGQRLDYWRLIELIEKEPSEKNKTALGVQVFRLKQKLIQAGADKDSIKSIHNQGYKLGTQIIIV